MSILKTSHLTEEQRLIVFLAGTCLAMAGDIADQADPGTGEGQFDIIVSEIVRSTILGALGDPTILAIDPEIPDGDFEETQFAQIMLAAGYPRY